MAAPIPRVALMFLTRGALPYEQLWAEWFRDVTEVLPLDGLQVLNTDPVYQWPHVALVISLLAQP